MKTPGVNTPDEYVASLDGWRLKLVRALRRAVRAAGPFEEQLKWGHLVYFHKGPAWSRARSAGARPRRA